METFENYIGLVLIDNKIIPLRNRGVIWEHSTPLVNGLEYSAKCNLFKKL